MDDSTIPARPATPVRRLEPCALNAELWLKDDGRSDEYYGGNKIRKLDRIVPEAIQRGARRIVTAGAAGSHHALATALFARQANLQAAAVLFPQPWTLHAQQTLRAAVAAGLQVVPVRSLSRVPAALGRLLRRDDFPVLPGGATVSGTLGYIHAVAELIGQIRSGAVPEPDIIVVAVGSGGTAAGLIAGVLREGLRSCVHGVSVAAPAMLMRPAILGLALAALRRDGGSPDLLRLNAVLSLTDAERGPGYGVQTERGQAAGRVAESLGLELDPTYTEKGFAAALDLAGHPDWRRNRATMSLKWLNFRPPLRILYWHTLSSTPLDRLLVADPSLSSELQRLLPRR